MTAPSYIISTDPEEAVSASASGVRAVLYQGDCANLLSVMPDGMADLLVTSPPYFMGKEYDRSYNLSDFSADISKIAPDACRVVKPLGNMCWQVGFHVGQHGLAPLDFLIHDAFRNEESLFLRNRIVWQFGHGTHAKRRFSGRYETIMWYGKGGGSYFDLDQVRVPQKYPGKTHYKGPRKGELSGNPLGKNPGDVWDIPNVKARHCEKTAHPCQFPVALAQRLVRSLCVPEGLVCDPFSGSGSAAIAAILDGRRFIGAELSSDYCQIAAERLDRCFAGDVPYRPIDRDIYTPSSNSAVAKRPAHFII